jgi:hypothetical protein
MDVSTEGGFCCSSEGCRRPFVPSASASSMERETPFPPPPPAPPDNGSGNAPFAVESVFQYEGGTPWSMVKEERSNGAGGRELELVPVGKSLALAAPVGAVPPSPYAVDEGLCSPHDHGAGSP